VFVRIDHFHVRAAIFDQLADNRLFALDEPEPAGVHVGLRARLSAFLGARHRMAGDEVARRHAAQRSHQTADRRDESARLRQDIERFIFPGGDDRQVVAVIVVAVAFCGSAGVGDAGPVGEVDVHFSFLFLSSASAMDVPIAPRPAMSARRWLIAGTSE